MTRPTPPRPLAALVATIVVATVSGGIAFAAAWPIREGPAGTTCLVALLAFGISLMTGVSSSEPVMRRAAERQDRLTAEPMPDPVAVPAATPQPAPPRAGVPVADLCPDQATGSGTGRCFGCLRLEEVAGAGVLTLAESSVPLLLCRWCLEHLETWHAREEARLRADRQVLTTG